MPEFYEAAPKTGDRNFLNSFLVKGAKFEDDMPVIKTSNELPKKLIPFSKSLNTKDFDQWVCFYEDDYKFERIWNNPCKYIKHLQKFNGVISPDFSLYRDMPIPLQQYNLYRNKALGYWFQANGIEVIPNVRWAGKISYLEACAGIEKNKTIAVGSHGNIKSIADRQWLNDGLDYVIKYLTPKNIVFYGAAPQNVVGILHMQGINVITLESHTRKIYKEHYKNGNRE